MECSTVTPKLEILICTLEERVQIRLPLLDKLLNQRTKLNVLNDVIVSIEEDNGEMSIGAKRNKLLFRAQGEYVCFVDDDDDISDDYIESILKAIKIGPDCVGIEGKLFHEDKEYNFYHSIDFQNWYTGPDGFYRTPNHLNPIRREIVMKIMFPEVNFGEDQKFSNTIKKLLKTEVYIDHPIYFYMMRGKNEIPIN